MAYPESAVEDPFFTAANRSGGPPGIETGAVVDAHQRPRARAVEGKFGMDDAASHPALAYRGCDRVTGFKRSLLQSLLDFNFDFV